MFRQKVTNHVRTAVAQLRGDITCPNIHATVEFTQKTNGVLVALRAEGLPPNKVLGFHIHNGVSCRSTDELPFAEAQGHYNPTGAEHPYHAGDLPPIFSNNGTAYMTLLTNRFTVREIAGKAIIIHGGRDDFTTQPDGASGERLACGIIHIG